MFRFSAEEQQAIKKILQENLILNNINNQNKAAQNFFTAKLVKLSKNYNFLQAVAKNKELIEAIGNQLFKNLLFDPNVVLHNT
jgi:DNA polymerase III delta prime subunit